MSARAREAPNVNLAPGSDLSATKTPVTPPGPADRRTPQHLLEEGGRQKGSAEWQAVLSRRIRQNCCTLVPARAGEAPNANLDRACQFAPRMLQPIHPAQQTKRTPKHLLDWGGHHRPVQRGRRGCLGESAWQRYLSASASSRSTNPAPSGPAYHLSTCLTRVGTKGSAVTGCLPASCTLAPARCRWPPVLLRTTSCQIRTSQLRTSQRNSRGTLASALSRRAPVRPGGCSCCHQLVWHAQFCGAIQARAFSAALLLPHAPNGSFPADHACGKDP